MVSDKTSSDYLKEKNSQVHELNYVALGTKIAPKAVPADKTQARELARKIQENIQAYRDELNVQSRPSYQA